MDVIGIDGYNSCVGNNFYQKYRKKYKIYKFKSNINNISKLKDFLETKKISIFIRFAALSKMKCEKKPKECLKTNYLSNKKLTNYLTKKNNIKLIFISTSHVYSFSRNKIKENFKKKPNSKYGRLKLKSENYIKKKLVNYLIVRVFNIYAKNQARGYFIPDIKNKIIKKNLITINNSYRDFISVNEVTRFIDYSIKKKIKGIYNLGTGKSYSLKKIIKQLSEKLNIKYSLTVNNKTDKLVSNNSLLRKIGFKVKNEKNFNI